MAARENDLINERLPLLASSSRSSLNPLATTFSFQGARPPFPDHASPPLVATPADEEDLWAARQAHAQSPHTKTRDSSYQNSLLSEDSIPSLRTFRRSHLWIQFPLSMLICVAIAAGMYEWKKGEVRVPELLLGGAAFLASEGGKELVFQTLTWEKVVDGVPKLGTGLVLPTVVHATLQEALRLGAVLVTVLLLPDLPTLDQVASGTVVSAIIESKGSRTLPPVDTLFFSAFWVALGWALSEILVTSRDFWSKMNLYSDILEDEVLEEQDAELEGGRLDEFNRREELQEGGREDDERNYGRPFKFSVPTTRAEELEELQERSRCLEREELEAQLGVPLYEIPVVVVLIWRIDSILLSLVLTLLLSLPFRTTSPSLITFDLLPTFAVATSFHVFLSVLWVLQIKQVGIASVSYMTLIILLMGLCGVLGAWGALE